MAPQLMERKGEPEREESRVSVPRVSLFTVKISGFHKAGTQAPGESETQTISCQPFKRKKRKKSKAGVEEEGVISLSTSLQAAWQSEDDERTERPGI